MRINEQGRSDGIRTSENRFAAVKQSDINPARVVPESGLEPRRMSGSAVSPKVTCSSTASFVTLSPV
ncbi:MAG: hypothetical protein JW913_13490 [Chitinispirillaceae bacterium]|nr:hypothetical protein [Chitinispirillaceae bacterium]